VRCRNGNGAEYIFTQFQLANMPDAVFEGQVRTLTQELAILKNTLEVACPTKLRRVAVIVCDKVTSHYD
jgi:hypothetical protein